MCALFTLFGLAGFFVALTFVLGFDIFGGRLKVDAPLQMLGVSFSFMAVSIAFIFFGRSCFRPVLAQLDEMENRRRASSDGNDQNGNYFGP